MPGTQYIALSAMRSRLDELDRLAGNISNAGTTGFKGQRGAQKAVDRPSFGAELQTAIDTVETAPKIDFRPGLVEPTGRTLDAAIEGPGFFVVETEQGTRYTRDGHFKKSVDGNLVTGDGATVQGADGPLQLGPGEIEIKSDGSVYSGGKKVGTLAVVDFDDPNQLSRDRGAMLRNDKNLTPVDVEEPLIRPEALEGSNVVVAEVLAQLTDASRSFEALQKAISMVMTEVDGKSIETLGRR